MSSASNRTWLHLGFGLALLTVAGLGVLTSASLHTQMALHGQVRAGNDRLVAMHRSEAGPATLARAALLREEISALIEREDEAAQAALAQIAVSAVLGFLIVLAAGLAALRGDRRSSLAEARFRGLVEAAPDGLVLVAADGRIQQVNHAAERLFGYGRDELLGQPFEILVPETRRARHALDHAAFLAKPQSRPMAEGRDVCARRKDGTQLPVAISLGTLHNGDGLLVLAAVRDVTAQRQASAERERLIGELQVALAQVRTLSGLLPICAWCKKVRNDEGYWQQIEKFVADRTQARFSHAICPACQERIEGSEPPDGAE